MAVRGTVPVAKVAVIADDCMRGAPDSPEVGGREGVKMDEKVFEGVVSKRKDLSDACDDPATGSESVGIAP